MSRLYIACSLPCIGARQRTVLSPRPLGRRQHVLAHPTSSSLSKAWAARGTQTVDECSTVVPAALGEQLHAPKPVGADTLAFHEHHCRPAGLRWYLGGTALLEQSKVQRGLVLNTNFYLYADAFLLLAYMLVGRMRASQVQRI